MYIGLEEVTMNSSMLLDLCHRTGNFFCLLKVYFPAQTTDFMYHASIWLNTTIGGIMVEYTRRDTLNEFINKFTHYFNKDGLRFVKMNFSEYQNKVGDYKGLLTDPFRIIQVNPGNNFTLKEMLIKCGKDWRAVHYSFFTHNCQDFVSRLLEVTKAYRNDNR